jgi:hypothetical protein
MANLNYIGSKFLYLTSKNRQSGNINGCMLTFPQALFTQNNTNKKTILKVNLQNLTLNHSWDNVSNRCNSFLSNGIEKTIPTGSPSVFVIRDQLNVILDGFYIVSYDINNNRFTFTANTPTNSITPTTSGHLFGLVNNTTYTGTFTSIYPINVQYENSIFLNADFAVAANGLDNINSQYMSSSTIIGQIPITVQPYDNIIYNSFKNTNESLELSVMNGGFDCATFSITTDKGYLLDLAYDYTFVLKIEAYSSN